MSADMRHPLMARYAAYDAIVAYYVDALGAELVASCYQAGGGCAYATLITADRTTLYSLILGTTPALTEVHSEPLQLVAESPGQPIAPYWRNAEVQAAEDPIGDFEFAWFVDAPVDYQAGEATLYNSRADSWQCFGVGRGHDSTSSDRLAYVRGWDAAEVFDIESATVAPAVDTAPTGEPDPASWLAGYNAFRAGAQ